MAMPNGFTYMTDDEAGLIREVVKDPAKAQDLEIGMRSLSQCPSEEFLLTAVFFWPLIIRNIDNQSYWLTMLAVMLDKRTIPYAKGMDEKVRTAANDPDSANKIEDLKMPDYLRSIYNRVTKHRKTCGVITLLNENKKRA